MLLAPERPGVTGRPQWGVSSILCASKGGFMNKRPNGFQVLGLIFLAGMSIPMAAQVGFGGMGGLGGSSALPQPGDGGRNSGIGISPFVSVMGTYNHFIGLTSGQTFFGRENTWSGSGVAGVTGTKQWEHSSLGVGLVGGASYYPYSPTKWTQNYLGRIAFSQMVSPRLAFSVQEIGGTSIGGYGMGAGFGGFGGMGSLGGFGIGSMAFGPGIGAAGMGSTGQNGVVDTEIFNSRTTFSATTAGLNYRLTERWTASVFGGAAFVDRQNGLFSNNWELASGQLTYQIDARSQVGVVYQYSWLQYPNAFGNVRSQIGGVTYQNQLNRRTKIGLFAGALEIRSTYIGVVQVSPEIAELLGTTTSYQIQDTQRYSGSFGATIGQSYQRSNWSIIYWRGLTPGNGLALAGIRDMISATYGILGPSNWNFYLSGMATKQDSVVGLNRQTYNYQAVAGASRRLFWNIFGTMNGGWRVVQFTGQPRSEGLFASAGLSWSPREGGFVF
jgi:hypothetical protein